MPKKEGEKQNGVATGYIYSSLVMHINSLLQLKKYEIAEALLIDKIDLFKKYDLTNYLGSVCGQLSEVQLQKGNLTTALYYLDQALKYEQKHGSAANCKVWLSNMGKLYFDNRRDPQKALLYYIRALNYGSKDQEKNNSKSDSIESVNILSNIGAVYLRKGFYDSALYYFQLAFGQIKPGANETTLLNSSLDEFAGEKKIGYLVNLLINKADTYQQQYAVTKQRKCISEAVRIYKITDKLLERIKAEQSDTESKLFWRKDSRLLYEHAIEACSQDNNMDDAFYFFERSRAVLLTEQLNEQHWLNEEDISKITQVKKKILQLHTALNLTEEASGKYAALQQELFNKNHELDRLQQLIKEHNPLYYQSFLDTSKISLQYVKEKILQDHQALVEIFDGDSAVYSMVITIKKNYITRINKTGFDSLSNLYIHYLSNPGLLNLHFDSFVQVSGKLYQILFQNNPLPQGRIIISPDGRYFPFESLITNNRSSRPAYFLTDYAVSYTYSARYLLSSFASDSTASGENILGVAPVHYVSNPALGTLQGSDLSLWKIGSYLPGANNMIATNASRSNFLQQFPDYKIIQLYTHASDSSERKEPVIYFADSALYLSELIPEKKPFTQLIVLSACETGTGTLYQGEGVFSFNRGFAALGIPSSVTNLWSIDNVSTYRLTELFYKYLAAGLPIDISLQKAKLEFIMNASKVNQLPYYWAAAILVGKTNPVRLNKPFAWKYPLILFAIAILLYGGWKLAIAKKASTI